MIFLKKLGSKTSSINIYIPSLVTYIGCLLGILSICFSLNGGVDNFKRASILIILAGIMDKLDGFLARKLNAVSDFGRELDSLCDLISFGLAPMILWWNIDTNIIKGISLISAIFYILSGVFRLARFNVLEEDEKYIVGLPITIAGMIFASKIFIDLSFRIFISFNMTGENILLSLILSFFMLSSYKIRRKYSIK